METVLNSSASESVNQQRALVESLFERLAQDSRDEPGVTRAPYGPRETFAHDVDDGLRQRISGSRSAPTPPPTPT